MEIAFMGIGAGVVLILALIGLIYVVSKVVENL